MLVWSRLNGARCHYRDAMSSAPTAADKRFADAEEEHESSCPQTEVVDVKAHHVGERKQDAQHPEHCALRSRADDAEAVAREIRGRLESMDSTLLRQLVRARQSAVGIVDAFPDGDKRFASIDSDDSDEDEQFGQLDGDDDEGVEVEVDASGRLIATKNDDSAGHALNEPCAGLFDDATYPSPQHALAHAVKGHGFDLVAEMDAKELDFLARVRLVNYIRMRIRGGDAPGDVIVAVRDILAGRSNNDVLDAEQYLQPVIPGDVLLTVLESHIDDEHNEVAHAVHRCLDIGGPSFSVDASTP